MDCIACSASAVSFTFVVYGGEVCVQCKVDGQRIRPVSRADLDRATHAELTAQPAMRPRGVYHMHYAPCPCSPAIPSLHASP
jgi:hypothetical protein